MTMPIDAKPAPHPETALSRLAAGASSVALSQMIAGLGAIILVPLFLRAWGADVYGRWIALTAAISYLSLLDLGGQSFIGNLLTQAYARCDQLEFRQRLSEGVSLFVLVTLAAFGVLAGALMWPGLALPGQARVLTIDERLIILFMATPVLIGVPGGVYVTAYRATGRLARGVMIGNIIRGLGLVAFAVTLLLGLPPLAYAAVYFCQGLVLTLVVIWDLTHKVPAARSVEMNLHMARRGRRHIRGSVFFWIIALAYALNFQGIVLVLAAVTTPAVVALYSTQRTAAGLISYISNLFQAPLWPELTTLHAQQRHEELAKVNLLAIKTVSLLSAVAAAGLWFLMPFIYSAWTGKQLQFDPVLFGLLLLQATLLAGWNASGWVLLATNQHRPLALWSLANAGVTLILAYTLGRQFGVIGVALATLVGDILCGLLVYPQLASQQLYMQRTHLYASILQPITFMALAGFIGIWLLSEFSGILYLLAISSMIVLMTVIVVKLSFSRQEVESFLHLVRLSTKKFRHMSV